MRTFLIPFQAITLVSLLASARLFAAGDHDPAAAAGHDHAAAHAHPVTIELPTAADALWSRINHIAAGLAGHLAAADLAALASDATNLGALLGNLDPAMDELPADARTRAKGMHANARRAADSITHAADVANAAAAGKAVKQLTGVLALLKASFPKAITAGNQAPKWVTGPHEGRLAPLLNAQGMTVAWVELKLHDDKGDLELWLASDARVTRPHDLPTATTITVAFTELDKKVTLRVRNAQNNEGEDGKPNVRAGTTNYFIFPGDTGTDASWLKGAGFSSPVEVTVAGLKTPPFTLFPHTHAAGHAH